MRLSGAGFSLRNTLKPFVRYAVSGLRHCGEAQAMRNRCAAEERAGLMTLSPPLVPTETMARALHLLNMGMAVFGAAAGPVLPGPGDEL